MDRSYVGEKCYQFSGVTKNQAESESFFLPNEKQT